MGILEPFPFISKLRREDLICDMVCDVKPITQFTISKTPAKAINGVIVNSIAG